MPVSLLLRRNTVPERNSPTVSVPLPSQSPQTGWSPRWPKANTVSAVPDPGVLVRKKTPARKTPRVSTPSPFQSHASGMSPACPNGTAPADAPTTFPEPVNTVGWTGAGRGAGAGGGAGARPGGRAAGGPPDPDG